MPEAIRFDTHGRRSLVRFLRGISQTEFAEIVDVSQQTVSDWLLGKCRPGPLYRARIEAATVGAVKADAWRSAGERRRARAA